MFKLRNLFALGITAGHQSFYSTPMLDFFYLGSYDILRQGVGLKVIVFKLKEILFCLLVLKNFLVTAFKKKNKLIFLLIFSNLNQYLVVYKLFASYNRRLLKNFFLPYFMLCPEVGFLSSPTQRKFSFQEDVDLPSDIFFKKTLVISFGDAVLPIVVHEAAAKRGLVIGIVDSNQAAVWSHVDYILPGNDDSVIVAYFFGLFLLNILMSILPVEFNYLR